MILSTNWTNYLHAIRRREVDMVFSLLSQNHFASGLEVGAGDGYQTTLLAPHIDGLISSDLNFKRIKVSLKVPEVEYKTVDADTIAGVFEAGSFDFIFSSNVLEHLRDPRLFLQATHGMLRADGYVVHIVPSRHIKISYLLGYYPHLVLLALDRSLGRLKGEPLFKGTQIDLENNINVAHAQKKSSRLRKFLFPSVHGNFLSHTEEYIAYGEREWERLFKETGYTIAHHAPGPAFSGYGFGLSALRAFFERMGASSEHIFVLKKMSTFESVAWTYINSFLPRGSFYEREKFVQDWLHKEENARAFVNDFIKAVGDPKGKKILDIGFGNGIIASTFAQGGAIVYGLETDAELLHRAVTYAKGQDVPVTFEIYDGQSFPFSDNMFDFVYSTSVLEHMSYPTEVLSEISRTLVPGGKLYLSFPNKYAPKESHTGLWFISWLPRRLTQYILKYFKSSPLEDWNLHFVSFFQVKKMAHKAGLRVVYDIEGRTIVRRSIKKMLAYIGVHYGVLLKTVILVFEKPNEHGQQ